MSNIRKYYENKFKEYPDVVDLLTFRQMMGGISDSFARLLIHEDNVVDYQVPDLQYGSFSTTQTGIMEKAPPQAACTCLRLRCWGRPHLPPSFNSPLIPAPMEWNEVTAA